MQVEPKDDSDSIGSLIDQLYAKRSQRLTIEKAVTRLKQEETMLGDTIRELILGQGLESASGATATYTPTASIVPTVTDWELVYGFIAANNAFHLIQKRLTTAAWTEYSEQGIIVPGTDTFTKLAYNLTKRAKK